MYFAVTKLTFDIDEHTANERKDLSALVEKVRARFKVCVQPLIHDKDSDFLGMAIASLGQAEERLSQQVDAIAEFCEESGFGRVAKEETLIDHMDSFGEAAGDDEA